MSKHEPDLLERCFLAMAGLGSIVLVVASVYGILLTG